MALKDYPWEASYASSDLKLLNVFQCSGFVAPFRGIICNHTIKIDLLLYHFQAPRLGLK
ncbi:hypothetical protein [Marinobacter sp.]|uniref:hypothetical protein n=1 Tax=Marinobacter sp. TaxID=50741 RepID=UPI003A934005